MPNTIKQFAHLVASPSEWMLKGISLLRASYPVWKKHLRQASKMYEGAKQGEKVKPGDIVDRTTDRFVFAYMLLSGLAMENLLKGLLVAQDGIECIGGKLSKCLTTHNLCELLESLHSGFQVTQGERMILDDLSQMTTWKGRYPTPSKAMGLSGDYFTDWGFRAPPPTMMTDLFVKFALAYPKNCLGSGPGPHSIEDYLAILKTECPKDKLPWERTTGK